MCDVIKIRLKTRDEKRNGMETPKKRERFLDLFYDVTHDTFCISVSLLNGGISNEYL